MKIFKKISLMIMAVTMVLAVVGCGNNKKDEETSMNNFNIKYEGKKEVDKIIYKVGEYESTIVPMHEDKKIKEGYTSNIVLPEEEVKFSIKIIDNDKVISKVEDSKIDLTNGKKAEIKIVDGKDGEVKVEVINN